ncbi:MAG: ribosome small subunit-dependent GTPase A, partial [Candidatus Cloacimonetes bacterium]|nr:ribosome small subunit-dependent GTPase A [Candidatus Cloacimonadota bacterium]
MKQKDKKRTKKYTGRLKNICLPDLDILDDEHHDIGFKSSRSAHKRNLVLKSDTELRKARVIEVMSNYQCRINLDDKQVNASIGGRLKQFKNESSGILAVGDYVEVDITYEP